MFKLIFVIQSIVYLMLFPILRERMELGYSPPLLASFVAIGGLGLGLILIRFRPINMISPLSLEVTNRTQSLQAKFKPRRFLAPAITLLAGSYMIVVLNFELLNRRLGSEFMADLYSNLPIYALIPLRIYEILFIPILATYLFANPAGKRANWFIGAILFASLFFMGIIDSRGRLLVITIFLLCFVRPRTLLNFLSRNFRVYLAGFFVLGAFVIFSVQRMSSYTSLNEYLFSEVYQRLDGLNLVTDLNDAGVLSKFGQFDLAIFSPLLSKIPFLEAAREAKMLGQTSTKQYYLQEILGRNQLDAPNSMITDPYYFAGLAGVLVVFCVLSYAISASDRYVAEGRLFKDWNKSALVVSFVTGFAMIESDLVAAFVTFLQNYILTAMFFRFGFRSTDASISEKASSASQNSRALSYRSDTYPHQLK